MSYIVNIVEKYIIKCLTANNYLILERTCSNKLVVYIILVTKTLSTYHCKYYNYK